jgi:serine/threonine-protein kinase
MNEHLHAGVEQTFVAEPQSVTIGRYLLHRQIARGGMATIHIARLMGDEGFSRIVAAKRLLPEFAEDAEFVAMFLDEARIASKVHHRNVVPVLDVVTTGEEVILVQEYVHGAPLHWLLRAARQGKTRIPLGIAVSIACQVLAGLHAAHETPDEMGMPLDIVHRDVSPQNVMIAIDGTARLLDFGVAKATMAAHVTREGQFKGKLAYSAPEQLRGQATRQSDLYSLAVLLWEIIVGHRMHQTAQAEAALITTVMSGRLPTITEALASERDSIGPDQWRELQALEPIITIGLAADVADRWATAADMEQALIDVMRPASSGDVAAWLKSLGRDFIDKHDRVLAAEEASWRRGGTTLQRRLAPVTGEVRRGTQLSFPSDPSAGLSQPQPVVPGRRSGSNVLIGLLCGLVVALAVGIVFAVRGPSAKTAAAESVAPPPPAPAARPSAVAPAVRPAESPVPPVAAPPAGTAAPVESEAKLDTIELEVERPPTPAVTGNVSAPARQIHPQPSRQITSPTKKTPPATPPAISRPPPVVAPPAPAEEPATSCNPPYYYEGQKKIFKPSCI